MTVLMRDELNESDLMWAAADLAVAGAAAYALRARVAAARFAPGPVVPPPAVIDQPPVRPVTE